MLFGALEGSYTHQTQLLMLEFPTIMATVLRLCIVWSVFQMLFALWRLHSCVHVTSMSRALCLVAKSAGNAASGSLMHTRHLLFVARAGMAVALSFSQCATYDVSSAR